MDRRIQEGRGEDRYETADHDDDRTLVRSLRPEDEQSKDRKEEPVPSASGDADRDLLCPLVVGAREPQEHPFDPQPARREQQGDRRTELEANDQHGRSHGRARHADRAGGSLADPEQERRLAEACVTETIPEVLQDYPREEQDEETADQRNVGAFPSAPGDRRSQRVRQGDVGDGERDGREGPPMREPDRSHRVCVANEERRAHDRHPGRAERDGRCHRHPGCDGVGSPEIGDRRVSGDERPARVARTVHAVDPDVRDVVGGRRRGVACAERQ